MDHMDEMYSGKKKSYRCFCVFLFIYPKQANKDVMAPSASLALVIKPPRCMLVLYLTLYINLAVKLLHNKDQAAKNT